MLFPIILAESNPAWPDILLKKKKCLEKVIEPKIVVKIEHIGSTAVPACSQNRPSISSWK